MNEFIPKIYFKTTKSFTQFHHIKVYYTTKFRIMNSEIMSFAALLW